jgi:glycosyltransferase involved in cell wall biosynthesis
MHNLQPNGKRVLLVGFLYYPATDVGARRAFNFKKYLTKLGHQVTVLTVSKSQYSSIDTDLETEDSENFVIRTSSFGPINVPQRRTDESISSGLTRRVRYILNSAASVLLVPDIYIGWAPHAIAAARALARLQDFDVVVSTAKPWSDFVIGDRIASALGLPHIMDYRDPWTAYEHTSFPNRLNKYISRFLEKGLIARAKYVILNTEASRELFLNFFCNESVQKFHVIRNGFDRELAVTINPTVCSQEHKNIFTLMHTGSFYGSRNIQNLFKAIAKLRDRKIITPNTFNFVSYGPILSSDRRLANELGIFNFILIHDFVSYSDSLAALKSSSMNLLVVGNDHGPMIPAKFFDYIMVRRPIFCIGPKGSDVSAIVEKESRGICVDISNSDEIADGLATALAGYKSGKIVSPLPDLAEYSFEQQVILLSRLVESATT